MEQYLEHKEKRKKKAYVSCNRMPKAMVKDYSYIDIDIICDMKSGNKRQ